MVDYLPQPNNVYSEDVSVTTGTAVISRPCQVWNITATVEASASVVLSISDDNATYSASHRVYKICFTGPDTVNIAFPHGLNLTRGLVVVSNVASVDIAVTYD